MNHELIGKIAGAIVVMSIIPYGIRVWQGKIVIKVTSWVLWSLIGLAILLTYKSSGAKDNIWPAVFGLTNPCLIVLLSLFKKGERNKMSRTDWYCTALSVGAIVCWWFVQDEKHLAQYALCLALLADACAAIPTIAFLNARPWEDRPFAWGAFSFAYGLNLFAVAEPSFANYILPVWMVIGGGWITLILVLYRIRTRVPLREWI